MKRVPKAVKAKEKLRLQNYVKECLKIMETQSEFLAGETAKFVKKEMNNAQALKQLFPPKNLTKVTDSTCGPEQMSLEQKVEQELGFNLEDLDADRFSRKDLQKFAKSCSTKEHKIRANQKSVDILKALKQVFQRKLEGLKEIAQVHEDKCKENNKIPIQSTKPTVQKSIHKSEPSKRVETSKKLPTKTKRKKNNSTKQQQTKKNASQNQKNVLVSQSNTKTKIQQLELENPNSDQQPPLAAKKPAQSKKSNQKTQKVQPRNDLGNAASQAKTGKPVVGGNLVAGGTFFKQTKKPQKRKLKKVRSEDDIINSKKLATANKKKRLDQQKEALRLRNKLNQERVMKNKKRLAQEKLENEMKKKEKVAKNYTAGKLSVGPKKKRTKKDQNKDPNKKSKGTACFSTMDHQGKARYLATLKIKQQQKHEKERLAAIQKKGEIIAPMQPNPSKPSKPVQPSTQYAISSDEGSNDDDDDDDDYERKRKAKKIPQWAQNPVLTNLLMKQYSSNGPDPDSIFPECPKTCDLKTMFPSSRHVQKLLREGRRSSGLWDRDFPEYHK